jgi:hypothetical protein
MEAEYLRMRYKKLFEVQMEARAHDVHLARRLKSIENEILDEKIRIEQARIEDVDETRQLQHTGEVRSSLQLQLDACEQKDTIAQYELVELKVVHNDLTEALSNMATQNTSLVEPVLENLRKEVGCPVPPGTPAIASIAVTCRPPLPAVAVAAVAVAAADIAIAA